MGCGGCFKDELVFPEILFFLRKVESCSCLSIFKSSCLLASSEFYGVF